MSDKKSVNEKISDVFDVEYEVKESKAIEKSKPIVVSEDRSEERHIKEDYRIARENMQELIGIGKEAIDGILKVAYEGDSPRAYEVASQMIKNIAEINQDLVSIHKQMKEINKEEINISQTNNSIYVGSTTDLQDLINEARSRTKAIVDNNGK
jgi:endonuclease III-like uncharacterized protein